MSRRLQIIPAGGRFAASSRPDTADLNTSAGVFYREMLHISDHYSDVRLSFQRVSLKTLGAGLKQSYPGARYLVLEDDPGSDGYRIRGLEDSKGDDIASRSGSLGAEPLLHPDGCTVEGAIGDLDRRSVRWMKGVTDDDGHAAMYGEGPRPARIDLDKAAALELPEPKSRLEYSVIGEENRAAVLDALDLAVGSLEKELEYAHTDEECSALKERLAALVRLRDA